MPGLKHTIGNLRQEMPLGQKVRTALANTWKKLRTRSGCCGNYGQPGC